MPRPRLALVAAVCVPVLGLLELGLAGLFSGRAPTELDWAASRERVAQLAAGTTGVVVAPWWAEPHARKAYGKSILPLRDIARPDESRYATLLEISAVGARLSETATWRTVREERLAHGLVARVLTNPAPATVRVDFTDRVEAGEAVVTRLEAGGEMPCPHSTGMDIAPGLFGHPTLPKRRFTCGAQPHVSVGVTVHEDERFRARRCIWTHPPDSGAMRVAFQNVPLGSVIRGHMSLHWTLERERQGTPIDLDVDVDGERVGTARHEDGEGWRLFELPLRARANSTAREVAFTVRSASADRRHLCWEADSR